MRERMDRAAESLEHSLRNVVSDAEHLLQDMGEEGSQQYRSTVDRLQRNIRHARDELGEYQESALHRARSAARAANAMVHEHPWQALGTAAALGIAVALVVLLSRGER